MIRSKFFWRNFLSYVLIIGFTTFVVSYLLVIQAEQLIETNAKESLQEKLVLFTPYFLDGSSWREPESIKLISEAAREAKTRLTVLDENETMLLETDADEVQVQGEDRLRPELRLARKQEIGMAKRYSDNSNATAIYAAKQIETPKGKLLLRVGVPVRNVEQRLTDILFAVSVGAAFGMLLSLLVALIIVRRITDPLSEMTRVAEAISRGNYAARIRRLPKNELGVLGEAINRLAEAVQANISRREKMERIRREFSSNVSHELKTPLTSIKGYVDTLLEGAIHDDKNNVRFLRIINNNAERMVSLVKDLLDLASIEANEDIAELETVDWRPIVQEVINRQQPRVDGKKISLKTDFECTSPLVRGQRKAMSHILDNLLQNAINYTPAEGRILIGMREKQGQCELVVSDNGIGISKKDQGRIFERFYRVDAARTRSEGGTGLGLAIVKHLVIQIQGSIAVESELERGATFTVRLPFA